MEISTRTVERCTVHDRILQLRTDRDADPGSEEARIRELHPAGIREGLQPAGAEG